MFQTETITFNLRIIYKALFTFQNTRRICPSKGIQDRIVNAREPRTRPWNCDLAFGEEPDQARAIKIVLWTPKYSGSDPETVTSLLEKILTLLGDQDYRVDVRGIKPPYVWTCLASALKVSWIS